MTTSFPRPVPRAGPVPKKIAHSQSAVAQIKTFDYDIIEKFNMRFRLLVILWLILLSLFIIDPNALYDKAKGKSGQTSTTHSKNEEIPELKDILESKSQDARLKAARKLVERVDVDKALEILEHSKLPHTGEGHLVVHQIGFYAYQKYGIDSILKCKDYFLYACYHGAIIEAASDEGFGAIVKMTDRCKASSSRYFQCVHAAGHSILAMWNYDLPKSLETCDDLYQKEVDFPEALSSCHNGAFMENLFGVHDWGTNKEAKRDWLSSDPYFPCNYFGEAYQKGCWLNQAARIYQMNNGDIVKTTKLCEEIGNEEHTAWCMDNVARQIHPLTQGNPATAFQLCQQVGPNWYNNCVIVNAGSFYSVGGRDESIFICAQLPSNLKSECFQRLIGQIASDPIEKDKKESICQKIEEPFRGQCLATINSTP